MAFIPVSQEQEHPPPTKRSPQIHVAKGTGEPGKDQECQYRGALLFHRMNFVIVLRHVVLSPDAPPVVEHLPRKNQLYTNRAKWLGRHYGELWLQVAAASIAFSMVTSSASRGPRRHGMPRNR